MLLINDLPVYVLSSLPDVFPNLRRHLPASCDVHRFSSPLDLIAGCAIQPPQLLIAVVTRESETFLTALRVLADEPTACRRLLLVESEMVDEIMQEHFRAGSDHVQLWPCPVPDFKKALSAVLLLPQVRPVAAIG